jgi:hypothetical protein
MQYLRTMSWIGLLLGLVMAWPPWAHAGSPAAYPASVYPRLSGDALARRKRLFHHPSQAGWTLDLDDYGYVREINSPPGPPVGYKSTPDKFMPAECARWESFILDNADLFGIDDLGNFHLRIGGSPDGTIRLMGEDHWDKRIAQTDEQLWSFQLVGGRPMQSFPMGYAAEPRGFFIEVLRAKTNKLQSYISLQGHFWPHAVVPNTPTVSESAIAHRFIGKVISWEESMGRYPYDPPGPPPVQPAPLKKRYTVQRKDLSIKLAAALVRNKQNAMEWRLVYHVNAKHLHARIDAMTGQDLPLE